jgi:hypothetical protein
MTAIDGIEICENPRSAKSVWGHERPYKRHAVDRDVEHFCGWKKLLTCLGNAKNENEKNLVAFTFATGGRISEVLALRTDMFQGKQTVPPILIVRNMPLEKQYKKKEVYYECLSCRTANPRGTLACQKCGTSLFTNGKKRFKTEKLFEVRHEFPIRIDEPLSKTVVHTLAQHIRAKQPFIFLNRHTQKPFGRRWAYAVLRRIGVKSGIDLWPHRLRAERACQLSSVLRAESLLEWFSWEDWSTAKRYSKRGAVGLAEEMGVQVAKPPSDEDRQRELLSHLDKDEQERFREKLGL